MVARFELLSTLKVRTSRHSGLDPESPQMLRDVVSSRVDKGILNQVQDDGGATTGAGRRSCAFHHGFVGFGGIRPTLRKAYRDSSLDNFPGKLS